MHRFPSSSFPSALSATSLLLALTAGISANGSAATSITAKTAPKAAKTAAPAKSATAKSAATKTAPPKTAGIPANAPTVLYRKPDGAGYGTQEFQSVISDPQTSSLNSKAQTGNMQNWLGGRSRDLEGNLELGNASLDGTRFAAAPVKANTRLAQEQTNQPAAAPRDPNNPPALTVPVTPQENEPPVPAAPPDGGNNTGELVDTPPASESATITPPVVTPPVDNVPLPPVVGSAAEALGRPVAQVRIVGNRVVPNETILLQVQGTRPGTQYSPRQIEADRQRIDALGFFASVQHQVQPNLEDPTRVDVTFIVVENRLVTGFKFEGNVSVPSTELEKVLQTKTGTVLNRNTINQDVEKIQDLYRERGFAGLVTESRQDEAGNVIYIVREASISRVDISGLKKTRESLVRRMIRTKNGDLFDQTKIRQDLNRIYDMGFFEDVSYRITDDPDKPGFLIVTIVLKERRTGQLSLGAGFDNRSRITGFAAVSESNFKGSGKSVGASIELGGRRTFGLSLADPFVGPKNASYSVEVFKRTSFREPRLVNKIIGNADDDGDGIPNNEEDENGNGIPDIKEDANKNVNYSEDRMGIRANFTQPLDYERTKNWIFGFRREEAELRRLDSKGQNLDLPISSTGTVFAFSGGFLRDKRDSRLEPSRGGREQFIVEKSFSFLGGTTDFTKLDMDIRRYLPLLKGEKPEDQPKLILAGRLVVGRAFGQLPAFEQYFVGGSDTVRGYETDIQFGDNQFFSNVELRYRFNRQFQFVGFFDAGGASGGKFSSSKDGLLLSAGVGLRVRTPIGPVRLDIARPLAGDEGSGFKTHFAIGPTF